MRGRSAPSPARLLLDQLRDERSRRVVLVSHCLLNENTRYAGGATRPGAVAEAVGELIAAGCGIHQLPCPERLAWGGVLKPHSLHLYHSQGRLLYPLRGLLLQAFDHDLAAELRGSQQTLLAARPPRTLGELNRT